MTVANPLAYYDTATITAVISYTVHAPEEGGQTQGPFSIVFTAELPPPPPFLFLSLVKTSRM